MPDARPLRSPAQRAYRCRNVLIAIVFIALGSGQLIDWVKTGNATAPRSTEIRNQ